MSLTLPNFPTSGHRLLNWSNNYHRTSCIYIDTPSDWCGRSPDSGATFHYTLAHNVCIMFGLNKQCEEAKGNHRHAAQSVNAQNMYIDFCMHIYVDHTSDQ